MGSVIIVFRIMPKGPEAVETVKAHIEGLNPQRIETEDVAFGLKALKVTFIIPDSGGEQDALENRLNGIDEINNIEILTVSRSL